MASPITMSAAAQGLLSRSIGQESAGIHAGGEAAQLVDRVEDVSSL